MALSKSGAQENSRLFPFIHGCQEKYDARVPSRGAKRIEEPRRNTGTAHCLEVVGGGCRPGDAGRVRRAQLVGCQLSRKWRS